jgi:hypothetical protein
MEKPWHRRDLPRMVALSAGIVAAYVACHALVAPELPHVRRHATLAKTSSIAATQWRRHVEQGAQGATNEGTERIRRPPRSRSSAQPPSHEHALVALLVLMAAKGMDERCRTPACGPRRENFVRARAGQQEQRRLESQPHDQRLAQSGLAVR